MIGAGKNTGAVGTLTITNNLTVQNGGVLRVRGRSSNSVDAFKVAGKISLTDPVFQMERLSGEWTPDTDYKIFTGNASVTLTGTPTFEPAIPLEGYKWDYSSLTSEGIIRIVSDPTGIEAVNDDRSMMNGELYDLSGRKSKKSGRGVYIMKGKKILLP